MDTVRAKGLWLQDTIMQMKTFKTRRKFLYIEHLLNVVLICDEVIFVFYCLLTFSGQDLFPYLNWGHGSIYNYSVWHLLLQLASVSASVSSVHFCFYFVFVVILLSINLLLSLEHSDKFVNC